MRPADFFKSTIPWRYDALPPVTNMKFFADLTAFSRSDRLFGRSGRIRTDGIEVPNFARYQLRHTPIGGNIRFLRSNP